MTGLEATAPPTALDPETPRAVTAQEEHQLAETDRWGRHRALCRSAGLKQDLGRFRALLAGRRA
jgi:hypothetical protein